VEFHGNFPLWVASYARLGKQAKKDVLQLGERNGALVSKMPAGRRITSM
jgi:hypothetical protein